MDIPLLAFKRLFLLYIPESSECRVPVHPQMHREAVAS